MQRILIALGFVGLGTASALAADLPARTYTKAPVVSPGYNWTGFYVGAMAVMAGRKTSMSGVSPSAPMTSRAASPAARSAITGKRPAARSYLVSKPTAPGRISNSPRPTWALHSKTGSDRLAVSPADSVTPSTPRCSTSRAVTPGPTTACQPPMLWARFSRKAGFTRAGRLVAASNTASPRTGRPRSNTCSPATITKTT
jgi:hypothetical protein